MRGGYTGGKSSSKPDYLFEASFEVCNKVGGIYTVVSTKAKYMKELYGENYYAIGPYFKDKARIEFEEIELEGWSDEVIKQAVKNLSKKGIKCHCGKWNVPGNVNAILVDYSSLIDAKNEIKRKLWESFKIDSLRAGWDFEEPMLWSYAVGMLIEEISKKLKDSNKTCVLHMHEWLSAFALLYLKMKKADMENIGSVFTTHATMLGRAYAHSNPNFHEEIEEGLRKGKRIDESLAYKFCIEAKHQTEKKAAYLVDVFTTVSEVTADECEYILGKRPDIILPNGIDADDLHYPELLSHMHILLKRKVMNFLRGYFGPYYQINTENSRIIFISGRYEFKNKGIDIFIKALGRVNEKLKAEGETTDYFAFLLIPSATAGEREDVLENISLFRGMQNYVDELLKEMKVEILDRIATKRTLSWNSFLKEIMPEEKISQLRKLSLSFQSRDGNAPLCPFNLAYEESKDAIMNVLKENNLLNRKEDKIKVVFYPAYLSLSDRLLCMDYRSFLLASSAGIFPSYYEPWGYTPLEAALLGVLAVTTDLTGYGQFLIKNGKIKIEDDSNGIFVLKRKGRNEEEIVESLAKEIYKILKYSKEDIGIRKQRAYMIAKLSDWRKMVKYYLEAHKKALEKATKR